MRWLRALSATVWLLAAVLATAAPALAQGCGASNPNCIVPTAPPGTSNNQAASTAFVQNAVGGSGVSSVTNSDGTLTISPTTGAVVASLALGHANTWTAEQTFEAAAFNLGSDATGDIYYRNSSGNLARLGIGTGGQVLEVSGGLPSWQTASGGGSPCTVTASSLQYDNAGAFGCITNWTNNSGNLTAALGSITTNTKALTITGTFNASGTTFDAPLFVNITNTASNAASLLADFQVGGASVASIGAAPSSSLGALNLTVTNDSLFYILMNNSASSNSYGILSGYYGPIIEGCCGTAVGIGTEGATSGASVIIRAGGSYPSSGFVGFNSSSATGAPTTQIGYDGDYYLGERNSTHPMTLRVYNTSDTTSGGPPTNFEAAEIDWNVTSNVFTLGTIKGGTGSVRGMAIVTGATNAITISTAQLVALPAITTDATHPDATVCEDTTSHGLYYGSGTAGICLGTSSLRYKHDVAALDVGLAQVMALNPIRYRLNADHGDPDKLLYGFSAEQGGTVLPHLMTRDAKGEPNTFDYLGVVPVLVRAIQQQQAEIDDLKRRVQ